MESVTHTVGEIFLPDGKSLLKMWEVNVSPGERDFTRHSHLRFEIAAVNSGEGVYRTEGAVYPMREGDVFVFSSNEVHCITGVSGGGMSLTNLHFEPRYLTETHGDAPFIRLCFSHAPQFCNRIPAGAAGTLRETLRGIREEFLGGGAYVPEAVRARLDLALIELLRHHGYCEGETVDSQRGGVLQYARGLRLHRRASGRRVAPLGTGGSRGVQPQLLFAPVRGNQRLFAVGLYHRAAGGKGRPTADVGRGSDDGGNRDAMRFQ